MSIAAKQWTDTRLASALESAEEPLVACRAALLEDAAFASTATFLDGSAASLERTSSLESCRTLQQHLP